MSNPDSFIEEVSEEVRRERLYRLVRRWGWVGVLAILLIVGGAIFAEWRRASAEAEARATGGAIDSAMLIADPSARAAALAEARDAGSGEAATLTALLQAQAEVDAGDTAAAAETLREVIAATPDPLLRDVARLHLVGVLDFEDGTAEERLSIVDGIVTEGGEMSLIAQEIRAAIRAETGDLDGARADLQAVVADALATESMRARAGDLLIALGGSAPAVGE